MNSYQNPNPQLVLAKKIGKSMANFIAAFVVAMLFACIALVVATVSKEVAGILAIFFFAVLAYAIFWGARWMALRDQELKK